MKTKDYKGLYSGWSGGKSKKFLYCEMAHGTEIFDYLETNITSWTSWQYDSFRNEDPSKYPEEIVLPAEFLT